MKEILFNEGGITLTDCVLKDNIAANETTLIASYGIDLVLNAVDFSDNTVIGGANIYEEVAQG